MEQPQYIALIGDLVDSRRIDDIQRNVIQEQLTGYFETLSPGEHNGIMTRPLITLGDEFQALFSAGPEGVRDIMKTIEMIVERARPAVVRFGLGVGRLTTSLQSQAIGMDGPCFHQARSAVTKARKTGLLCRIDTRHEAIDAVWGALASYCLKERSGWSDPQREAIELYEQYGTWSKVAAILGVTRGAVSLRQRAAGWQLYRNAWDSLTVELDQRLEEGINT